jgi:cytochrome P450
MTCPNTDFDIYDPALVSEADTARRTVARLAELGPVARSELYGGHWVVSGYTEVQEVLRHPETYSSWPNNIVPRGTGKLLPLEIDPPDHTAYRQSLQRLFNPARMKALESEIRGIVTELIDGFACRGRCEFVSEFAHPLPTRVFLALMGWPLGDAPMFTEATDTILLGVPGGTEEESNAAREQAAGQMYGHFGKVIADRRAGVADACSDTDDVTSAIITTPIEIDGVTRPLTDDELCNMLFLLLIAGLHTTQGSLAWSILHLARNPEQRRRLVEDPGLVPGAVEEMLRIEAAVSPGRKVMADTSLAGVSLSTGDTVLLVLAGANADAAEFDDPGEVRIDRSPNRHLSFGSGPHRCLGSHLARVELRIALEELHRRIPDYLVDAGELVQHPSQVRGVVRMPVTFTPEPVRA